MGDLIRFLSLVKAYADYQPPIVAPSTAAPAPTEPVPAATPAVADAPAETAPQPTEAAGLVVLLLDRCVGEATDDQRTAAWQRLQEHANDLLAQIARRGKDVVDATMITCGAVMLPLVCTMTLTGPK